MTRKLAPSIVFALALLAFLPALRNGFVSWDDRIILIQNPYFRGLGWDNIKWAFSNFTTGKYQPLSWLTFGLDYCLWEMNPAGYHLTAALIHAANAVLLFLIARRLFGDDDASEFGALFCALFWALSPLRVESVAWATERGDPLACFFYLSTTLLYLRGSLALSCLCYGLGLMSKATGITWPGVLLVLDAYPLRRLSVKAWKPSLARMIPYAALALAFAIVGLEGQSTTRAMVGLGRFGLLDRLAQACYAPGFYLAKTLWPSRLSPLYVLSPRLEPAPFFLGAAALAMVSWLLYRRRREWPAAAAAWIAYLAVLVPVAGLVKLGLAIAADRYSYLPSLPLAIFAGVAAKNWLAPSRRLALPRLAVLAAWLIMLAALTVRQTAVWHDSITFWRNAVAVDPDGYVGHKNLGDALTAAGRDDEATQHLIQSRVLLAKVRHEMGISYYESGNYEQALIRFAEALDAVPDVPETENDLGLCLFRLGRTSEAAFYFQKAVSARPDFVDARANWAGALASQGIFSQARIQFQKVLAADPGNAQAVQGLSFLERSTAK